ncbi:MAG: L,D-transpeptidase [Terriglobales bacterium]
MRQAKEISGHEKRLARWYSVLALLVMTAAEALTQDRAAQAVKAGAPLEHPRRHILVSIPDRKLALLEDDRILRVYPVAVGATRSPSPAGEFKVINRVTDPTYYHPGTVIPPGKDNPLGTRWIGLSRKGYGIHGTNQPRSIGRAASHGCIRMAKADMEELFTLVRAGDTVEIRSERDEQIDRTFGRSEVASAATTAAGQ